MKARYSISALFLVLAGLFAAGCATDKGDRNTAATGIPSVIYVADFQRDPSLIEHRKGLLGNEPVLNRIKSSPQEDPATKASKLSRVLSDAIVKRLKKEGFQAVVLPNISALYSPGAAKMEFVPAGAKLPPEGLLVTGWLEQIQEGNAALEATIGFGAGAGHANADVLVSDLANAPAEPFLAMGSGSRAKHIPGGLILKNPYVVAAKFVIKRRQDMVPEMKSLGAEIGKELSNWLINNKEHPQTVSTAEGRKTVIRKNARNAPFCW